MDLATPVITLDPFGSDLHGEMDRLREAGRIVPVLLPGDVTAWAAGYQDTALKILGDGRFVKDINVWNAWKRGEIPMDWPLIGMVAVDNMVSADGAEHTRLRTLISRAFTARRVENLRPRIEEITHGLLDALAEQLRNGPADLKAAFAYPLPMKVICELFGVPEEQRDHLGSLCFSLFNTVAEPAEVVATQREIRDTLIKLTENKRSQPGDDLTSALVNARDNEDRLSESELVDTLLLTITAGHETTVSLITNAAIALLSHPEQLALVRSGEAGWRDVVEETLRWDGPVGHIPFRYAACDVELDGVTIRAGDPVMISYLSYGRDPEHHGDDAHVFDLRRKQRGHLAFSHGPHHCLGAPLGRLEGSIALPALFERFPTLALATSVGQIEPVPSFILNGPTTLPVKLRS